MSAENVWSDIHSINLYKLLPMPTYVWRAIGGEMLLVDYNQAAKEFSGAKLDQFRDLSATEIYSDMPNVVELMNQCRQLRQPVVKELEMKLRTTGELKILKCTWIWIEPDIILYIAEDLTEIKESRQSLEQLVESRTDELNRVNRQLLKENTLFSQGPVVVIVWEPRENWPVSYVSENVQEILGYSSEEMTSSEMLYSSLIHPEDMERISQEVKRSFDHGIDSFEQYYRLKTKNGDYAWLYDSTVVEYDEQGEVTLLRGYLLDQTEIKNTEVLLQKEQYRLSAIIEGTNVGTWEWNIQTGETAFNERWAATIGYSLAELGPSNTDTWLKYAHPEDIKKTMPILHKHFKKELDYYEYEGRLRHKNGRWVWVLVRGKVAEWSDDGRALTMFGTHRDITERKNAELALKKMHVDLEQKIRKRTSELAMSNMLMQQEIKERKKSQEALLKSEVSLEQESASLQEANITLKVLMIEAEQNRRVFEEKVSANLVGLIDPYLNKLKKTSLDARQTNYVEIVEANLKNLVSPFVRTSIAMDLKLTPTEIQIANLIRANKSSKQIAELLSLSPLTIEKHRGNIRKKLGILNQKVNLKTLLLSS